MTRIIYKNRWGVECEVDASEIVSVEGFTRAAEGEGSSPESSDAEVYAPLPCRPEGPQTDVEGLIERLELDARRMNSLEGQGGFIGRSAILARSSMDDARALITTQARRIEDLTAERDEAREKPEPNPEWEARARAAHEAIRQEAGEPNPFDTLTMLETWTSHAEPADSEGRVSFSRAMLESAHDALEVALEMARREYLMARSTSIAFGCGAQECREMLARFVEQGGDATTAASLRANWNPEWGADPGPPRNMRDHGWLGPDLHDRAAALSSEVQPLSPSVASACTPATDDLKAEIARLSEQVKALEGERDHIVADAGAMLDHYGAPTHAGDLQLCLAERIEQMMCAGDKAAELQLSKAEAQMKGMREDAARWRGLMSCPRIRMYGSAGVDPKTGERNEGTHVHFGADFWSQGVDEGEQSGSASTAWGRHCLTALADARIEIEAALEKCAAKP